MSKPLLYSGYNRGFTLVELIVVIIIVGILSVVAAARFQGKGGFSGFASQKQLVSALRNIQQQAMQDTSQVINGGAPYAMQFSLAVDSDVTISATNGLTGVGFNALGQPVDASNNQICLNDCQIALNDGEVTANICIEAEGYIYAC
ncbi:prepilin-type N-terminal cleavage/methylation domain-containing protein [Neptunicella sp. SCSIO 80796]|uniref:prepilin-type N-terminal cleavage/methylation domain-containing protein n=1 Tax=Neptunicella plasticusilytica TaxID=3117012 RepID=UPI003A4D417E